MLVTHLNTWKHSISSTTSITIYITLWSAKKSSSCWRCCNFYFFDMIHNVDSNTFFKVLNCLTSYFFFKLKVILLFNICKCVFCIEFCKLNSASALWRTIWYYFVNNSYTIIFMTFNCCSIIVLSKCITCCSNKSIVCISTKLFIWNI